MARAPVVVLVLLVLFTFWSWSGVARADPHTESAAKEALTKAQGDYSAGAYANAALTLKKALTACGTTRCSAPLRAVLLRDYGVMQFRTGDRTGAGKSFDDALALDSSILLDPNYDAWDVGSAFEDSRAAAGLPAGTVSTKPPPGGGPPPTPPPSAAPSAPASPSSGGEATNNGPTPPEEQPTGGYFSHEPALEQRENTPLPIYAEYTGRSKIARVVVHYKGTQMRDWQRIDLHRDDNGYSGMLPCGDVTRGTMLYWIQGFDAAGASVGASGDPNRPYHVPIRDRITGEAPHLPGKEPPRSCEDTDCPPGIAGCAGGKKAEPGAAGEAAGAGDLGATQAPSSASSDEWEGYSHVWVGGSFGVEFLALPSANDVCRVDGVSGAPINSAHYLCFGFDPILGGNSNYPSSGSGMSENEDINYGGTAPGGLTFGDIRVLFALDYALSANALAGFRFGGVFNSYPGRGAGFPSRLHWELRGTYLFGRAPLSHRGFAPLVVAGVGLSEFDGRTATHDLTINGLVVPQTGQLAPQSEDVWLSNGPYFVMAGVGLRYQWSRHVALTGDVRLNVSFGLNGVLPTFGPEIAVQFGF